MALARIAAGIVAPFTVPVAGLERHEPVLSHVGARSLEAAVPLAARLAAALKRRHPEPELLDGLDVELRAGLERRGEPAQLREVVELEGPLGGLADPRGARVRGAVGAFALEAPAEHLLAVDEPQALAADLLGRLLGEAEHPVVPPRLGRVVGDVHAQGVEDAEELRLVARRGLGERDAGADVADPRVAARAHDLLLGPAQVDAPAAPGPARTCPPARLRRRFGRPVVGEPRQPALARHVLKVAVEVLGVLGLHAVAGAEVGVVHDDVRVRYAAGVVVVVHDGDLVVAEVLESPRARELAQRSQVDVVAGVRREHEVLERARGLSTPGGVRAERGARGVHLGVPGAGLLGAFPQRAGVALVVAQVEQVAREGAPSLLEVASDASGRAVAAYRLQDRHGEPSTSESAPMRPSSAAISRAAAFTSASSRSIVGTLSATRSRSTRPWRAWKLMRFIACTAWL